MQVSSIHATEASIAFASLKDSLPDDQTKLNQAIQNAGAPSDGNGNTDIPLTF
jgi:hypothetical protein